MFNYIQSIEEKFITELDLSVLPCKLNKLNIILNNVYLKKRVWLFTKNCLFLMEKYMINPFWVKIFSLLQLLEKGINLSDFINEKSL